MSRNPLTALATIATLTVLSACGGGNGADQVTLRVFAAASLTESFTELAERFESRNPGVRVELNFGPSSGLAQQISSGAPADVYASASAQTMDAAVTAGEVEEPRTFATNRMQIAVPPGNPGDVAGLADLSRRDLKIALCQPQVPCGAVSAEIFDRAGLDVRPATEEVDVKGVLTKVSLGEVDAGVVYVTDVLAAGAKVRGIEIPEKDNAETDYPIATVTSSSNQGEAADFVELVLSSAGAAVLTQAGFAEPQ